MLVFKTLHILAMFAAVALLMGDAFFLAVAFWRRDVRALATVERLVGTRPVVGSAIFLVGIVFGLLTAATGGIDFFDEWLIAAYVLVALIFLVNLSPAVQRMPKLAREAVEAEAGRGSSEEVARGMSRLRTAFVLSVGINAVLFAAVIADMIIKPF